MLRRIGRASVIGLVVILLVCLVAKMAMDASFFSDYDPTAPLNATATEPAPVDETSEILGMEVRQRYRQARVAFEARPDEVVPTIMTFPMEEKSAYPAIVLLHGMGMKKEFVTQIATPLNEADFVVASFDQALCGEREAERGPLATAIEWRARAWKTVNDTRRTSRPRRSSCSRYRPDTGRRQETLRGLGRAQRDPLVPHRSSGAARERRPRGIPNAERCTCLACGAGQEEHYRENN